MRKVLIADDEKTIRNGISTLVARTERYEIVAVCSNGQEAYEKTVELCPDIVITDIRMPLLDGLGYITKCSTLKKIPKFIILSGYQEFEYLHAAHLLEVVDYILKPVNHSELITLLDTVSEKIKAEEGDRQFELSQYGILLIQHHEKSKRQIEILKKKLDIEVDEGRAAIISIKGSSALRSTLLLPMVEHLREYCRRESVAPDALFIYENRIVCIFINSRYKSEALIEQAETAVRSLTSTFDVQCCAGIGEREEGKNGLRRSYHQALKALLGCVYAPGDSVYRYKKQWLLHEDEKGYYKGELRKTDLALKSDDFGLAAETVEHFFQRLSEEKPDPEIMLCFTDRIGSLLNARFEEISIELPFDSLSEAAFQEFILSQHPDLQSVKDKVLSAIREYFDFSSTQSPQTGIHVTDEIIDFLNSHLSEDIYLDLICEKFLINKSYLCSLFKEKTGKTFNTYLTALRITKSKTLLSYGNYRINEIANLVGFKNPRYFTRTFQKYVRMTPTEYRNVLSKETV